MKGTLEHVEALLARALRGRDPVSAITSAAGDASLPEDVRRALANVDPDGVRISAILIARLRFERLLRGSPEAERAFEEDPERFANEFRRYHCEVAPTEFFPQGEARSWQAWRAQTSR